RQRLGGGGRGRRGRWGRWRVVPSTPCRRQGDAKDDHPGSLTLARLHARSVLVRLQVHCDTGQRGHARRHDGHSPVCGRSVSAGRAYLMASREGLIAQRVWRPPWDLSPMSVGPWSYGSYFLIPMASIRPSTPRVAWSLAVPLPP